MLPYIVTSNSMYIPNVCERIIKLHKDDVIRMMSKNNSVPMATPYCFNSSYSKDSNNVTFANQITSSLTEKGIHSICENSAITAHKDL